MENGGMGDMMRFIKDCYDHRQSTKLEQAVKAYMDCQSAIVQYFDTGNNHLIVCSFRLLLLLVLGRLRITTSLTISHVIIGIAPLGNFLIPPTVVDMQQIMAVILRRWLFRARTVKNGLAGHVCGLGRNGGRS